MHGNLKRARKIGTAPLNAVQHIILPCFVARSLDPLPGDTIGEFVLRNQLASRVKVGRCKKWSFQLPTVCVINGEPILQRHWKRRRIKPGDEVKFCSRPWGKSASGKQIAGLVALIALAVLAPYAGTAIAGALGLGGSAVLGISAASIISGVILLGGALLVGALTKPKVAGQGDKGDQLFSVAASGNSAQLMQPIPVQYGRLKSFPDFAVTPWSEFIGNDQYLNVLLSIGLGKYDFETLYIDDTILWTSASGVSTQFEGVSVDFYDPAENVTLFPVNVVQSSEVSGQAITQTPVGGFIANPSGTIANALAFDIVFPAGMFTVDKNDGSLHNASIVVQCEVRPVDGAGAPTGPFVIVASQDYTFNVRTPQRSSIKVTLGDGRYEARISRTSAPSTSTDRQDDVTWEGLRAFIKGPSSFPSSTVAIRIKATNQLSQQSARKFGVLCTRFLDVWNGSIFVPTLTRNAFWAVWDAATNTDYGLKRPASKIDFQTIFDMATAADARGDKFDYRFTSVFQAPEALDTILRGARSRHRWSGDILTFVRDEWATVPRMLLTDREIVRGSLSVEYAMNTDNSSDAIILEYLDENTWGPADVQYPPNDITFTALQPTRIRVDGVVNRAHAYREAGFYYLQSQLRRVNVTLDTEHDGRMLGFGSRVRVQSELPTTWGYTGVVLTRVTNVLTVTPAPTWAATGQHFIAVRAKTGRQFGPIKCAKGASDDIVVLDATDLAAIETANAASPFVEIRSLNAALARTTGADDPSFALGVGTLTARDCVVMNGRPAKDRVTLGLVVDNIAVHSTSLGGTPILPTNPAIQDPISPIIANLKATFRQGIAEPILDVSWWPAAGAVFYRAEVSYDTGTTWTPIYEGGDVLFSKVVDRAALRLRVQGVNDKRHGAYSQVDVGAPTIVIAPNTVKQSSLEAGLRDYVSTEIKKINDNVNKFLAMMAAAASEQDAANYIDRVQTNNSISVSFGLLSAGVSTAINASLTTQAAFASFQTTVNATYGSTTAFVTQTFDAVAKVDGTAGALYVLSLNAGGKISGFKLGNSGSTSFFTIESDVFQVGSTGVTGGTFVPVFQVANVGGTPKITVRGDIIADGAITAAKISVATLSAITADVGTLTAGTIRSADSKMIISLTNRNIIISD
jgi:hypothetical protein